MLAGSAALIYKMTITSLAAKSKYPIVSCSNIEKTYAKRFPDRPSE